MRLSLFIFKHCNLPQSSCSLIIEASTRRRQQSQKVSALQYRSIPTSKQEIKKGKEVKEPKEENRFSAPKFNCYNKINKLDFLVPKFSYLIIFYLNSLFYLFFAIFIQAHNFSAKIELPNHLTFSERVSSQIELHLSQFRQQQT